MLGDKVHRPPDQPDFHERAMRSLRETEGLRWHGAVPRAAVPALLADCDLALSIRDPGVEAAREISTKVLEYGAAGLPVVLNRAPAYEALLGEDYPLFIDGPGDAAAVLAGPALDPATRAAAAAACRAASQEFTFGRVAARLVEQLPPDATGAAAAAASTPTAWRDPTSRDDHPRRALELPNGASAHHQPATRVLHRRPRPQVHRPDPRGDRLRRRRDRRGRLANHTEHDEAASRAAFDQADVILCEWCLGNAAWYSKNKRPDQRLVIRLHRDGGLQPTIRTRVDIDNVDQVVFDSQHILDEAVERFGWDPTKLPVIPNASTSTASASPSARPPATTWPWSATYPKLKRLDLALDILERLRRQEPRFRLIARRPPAIGASAGWSTAIPRRSSTSVTATPASRTPTCYAAQSPSCPSPRPPSFFQHAGFILSTSESRATRWRSPRAPPREPSRSSSIAPELATSTRVAGSTGQPARRPRP